MKKVIKMLLFAFVAFISITYVNNVYAEQYNGEIVEGEWIPNVYVRKDYGSTHKYQQGRFIKRSDGAYVYCLQPFVGIIIGNNYEVTSSDFAQIAGMSQDQWTRVSRLAYYGYGYPGHEDTKWYTITQVLIWRTVVPDADIYFTNTLNGTRNDSLYVSEINELNNMVNNHGKAPSINLPSETVIGNTVIGTDSNGVLEEYDIRNVSGGTVTPDKDDSETIEAQGEAALEGAVYGIYDETGTLIQKVTTGHDGKVYYREANVEDAIKNYRNNANEIEAEVVRIMNGMTKEQRHNIPISFIVQEVSRYYGITPKAINLEKFIPNLEKMYYNSVNRGEKNGAYNAQMGIFRGPSETSKTIRKQGDETINKNLFDKLFSESKGFERINRLFAEESESNRGADSTESTRIKKELDNSSFRLLTNNNSLFFFIKLYYN